MGNQLKRSFKKASDRRSTSQSYRASSSSVPTMSANMGHSGLTTAPIVDKNLPMESTGSVNSVEIRNDHANSATMRRPLEDQMNERREEGLSRVNAAVPGITVDDRCMTRNHAIVREAILKGTLPHRSPFIQCDYRDEGVNVSEPIKLVSTVRRRFQCDFQSLPVYSNVEGVTYAELLSVERDDIIRINSDIMKANAKELFHKRSEQFNCYFKCHCDKSQTAAMANEDREIADGSAQPLVEPNYLMNREYVRRLILENRLNDVIGEEVIERMDQHLSEEQLERVKLLSGEIVAEERNLTKCHLIDVRDFKSSQRSSIQKCVIETGNFKNNRNGVVLLTIPGPQATSLMDKIKISYIHLSPELDKKEVVEQLCECGFLVISHNVEVLKWNVPCIIITWCDQQALRSLLRGQESEHIVKGMNSRRGGFFFRFLQASFDLADFVSVCEATLTEICSSEEVVTALSGTTGRN